MFSLFVCEYDNKPLNGVHMCVGEYALTCVFFSGTVTGSYLFPGLGLLLKIDNLDRAHQPRDCSSYPGF